MPPIQKSNDSVAYEELNFNKFLIIKENKVDRRKSYGFVRVANDIEGVKVFLYVNKIEFVNIGENCEATSLIKDNSNFINVVASYTNSSSEGNNPP